MADGLKVNRGDLEKHENLLSPFPMEDRIRLTKSSCHCNFVKT